MTMTSTNHKAGKQSEAGPPKHTNKSEPSNATSPRVATGKSLSLSPKKSKYHPQSEPRAQ